MIVTLQKKYYVIYEVDFLSIICLCEELGMHKGIVEICQAGYTETFPHYQH